MPSCVLNNGFTTDLFQVRCGVRQGDPLSHFTIHLSPRSTRSPNSRINEIRGILVDEEEIKVTLFADDITCFLSDIALHHRSVATVQFFSRFSNLHVNNEKNGDLCHW